LGGSSQKRFIAAALWRITTPGDAGAIHPIRNSDMHGLRSECLVPTFLLRKQNATVTLSQAL
jgi:hypothetical protein